jgi:anti-anti-sigma regulatory factor
LLRPLVLTAKIETIRGADGTTIRLIGQLGAEHLQDLKNQIAGDSRGIVLDMSEVTLVNVDVVQFLIECQARNIQLRDCPAYILEWILLEHKRTS